MDVSEIKLLKLHVVFVMADFSLMVQQQI